MSKKKTIDEFINDAKKIHGDKYDYSLVEYKDNNTKISVICLTHGIFEIRPNDHLSKSVGCNKCNNAGIIKSKNTGESIINRFNNKHKFKYDYSLVNYNGIDKKIKIICPLHGIFHQTPHHHLLGCGCQKCSNQYKPTTEEFINDVNKIHKNKYDYSLVEYKNSESKIKIICPIHGIFEQRPRYHLKNKSGCPICNESKGERIIRNFLIETVVNFIPQKRFKDCRDIKPLPFDFYLPDYDICIEYDGEQHYNSRCNFGGKNRFLDIKRKDNIKNEYCEKNNIYLIRISYNDDVTDKLTNEIKLKIV